MGSSNQIQLRPKAEQDLENIYEHSLKEFGDNRATQYIQELNIAFMKIAHRKTLGKDCSFITPELLA